MSRIFLTGATGVLGRRAVPRLVATGHEVSGVARSDGKAAQVAGFGATPVTVDLFDGDAVRRAVDGHDVVMHLATNIPTGASAAVKRGWAMNDRLRSEVAGHLSRAAIDTGASRYVQESITFPYTDGAGGWIDESHERTYFWGNQTVVDAERAADDVTVAGATGVVLRFAMFMADDSAHLLTFARMAERGLWGVFGDDDAHISFIDADDAAAAVVASIDAPAGIYNVAEAEPLTRGEHRARLAQTVGRPSLRALPRFVRAAGGKGAESLARSHRISSQAFRTATGWSATNAPIDRWEELT